MVIRQLDIVINVHLSSQRSFEKKKMYLFGTQNQLCMCSVNSQLKRLFCFNYTPFNIESWDYKLHS